MSFQVQRPTARLATIVERLWLIDEPLSSGEAHTICPDGRCEVVFHLGDPMRQTVGGADVVQPRSLLAGQITEAMTLAPIGRMTIVGARFAPAGLRQFLPLPQSAVTGRIIEAGDVWAAWTRETTDRLHAAANGDRLNVLAAALERLIVARDEEPAIAAAVRRLELTGGNASIDRLASDAGQSRRQFERRFRDHVGLPPRLFGRIVRFQRAFRAVGRENGAAIAARCGYVDQAHMVREIRRFAGTTPTALIEADDRLTEFFRNG